MNSKLNNSKSAKPIFQNSKLKTQNSKLPQATIQNSKFKIQNCDACRNNSKLKIQNSKFKIHNMAKEEMNIDQAGKLKALQAAMS
ncbi:MAG: hypothetical protein PUH31_08500, partial [Prevotella stercorea]|uniref:hypothetical protein n=1 Tax=Leyella stercorea TaxID=363265 RepID=UPI0028008A8B|nr:hypothetical protein [Leyella stercorea]MDY5553429.1 hypothetical protein [Prevotella sp.]